MRLFPVSLSLFSDIDTIFDVTGGEGGLAVDNNVKAAEGERGLLNLIFVFLYASFLQTAAKNYLRSPFLSFAAATYKSDQGAKPKIFFPLFQSPKEDRAGREPLQNTQGSTSKNKLSDVSVTTE